MTGQLFGDRYQVGDTLGFGGMSEVHRGRDLRLGRDVAIKVLRADLARDPSFQTRFRREAQNAASLNHPAIVAVYDTGETEGESGTIPYIVMEYVDGETLRDLLKREGSLEPARAMEIVADVCAALDFSHRHGIVHRDIKPANVMLTRAGAVKVMDFGIARAVADGQATMTATAAVIGTAQYLSPEQARGEAVDARSDVYATGCVLFELLVGAPPFTGDSPVAVAYQHVREDPKAPSEVKPGLPRELDSIVLKALNKNPLNRYQTASEMRADLVRALSGQAVHATPILNEDERTTIMRATPERVGSLVPAVPSLLAPPRRVLADEIWEEEEPDRAKRVWGFVGVGVLCLALLAGAIYFTMKLTDAPAKPAQVAAPQVQQLSVTKAEDTIKSVGLIVGTIKSVESTAPTGLVTKQDPSSGTLIDKGKPVNLEVSKGISAVAVPNLATLSADAANNQLAALNLVVGKVSQVPSKDAERNTIIKQSPAAGTSVKPGTAVAYSIGSGPVYTKVPADLVGKSYDQAVAELKALQLTAVQEQTDGVQPKNTVLALKGVAPGANVPQGTPITLQVSNNNQFVMPSLQYLSPEDAFQQLKNAGWSAQSVSDLTVAASESTDRAVIGKIGQGVLKVGDGSGGQVDKAAQDPAVGAKVSKTARVSVVVYTAKQIVLPQFTPGVTTRDEIVNALNGLGDPNVNVVTVNYAPTKELVGTFISMDPVADATPVDFDTTVNVRVWGDTAPPPPPPTTPKTTTPAPPPTTTSSSTTSSTTSSTSSSTTSSAAVTPPTPKTTPKTAPSNSAGG